MSLTKVTYSMIDGAPINVTDFGSVGDGATDIRSLIF
jgi:polygalacturonase